jgi:hypothetical protein
VWAALLGTSAPAHPVYTDHIEHQVNLAVGPTNIDITIELRFNELRSLSERRRMDGDRNGLISASERERYLRRIRRELTNAFHLTCGSKQLDLIELYEPKLDLLGVEGVSPSHHVLRLYYFARTPASLTAPVELVFENACWTSAPALWLFSAAGTDGIGLRADSSPASQPADQRPARLQGRATIAHIDQPPATRPAGLVIEEARP